MALYLLSMNRLHLVFSEVGGLSRFESTYSDIESAGVCFSNLTLIGFPWSSNVILWNLFLFDFPCLIALMSLSCFLYIMRLHSLTFSFPSQLSCFSSCSPLSEYLFLHHQVHHRNDQGSCLIQGAPPQLAVLSLFSFFYTDPWWNFYSIFQLIVYSHDLHLQLLTF